MRRLRLDEQFVDLQPLMFRERTEVYSKLDNRQQIKRFLRWHGMRVSQNAVGTTDLVAERARFSLQQSLARVVFLINDRLDDLGQTIDDVFLLFTECGLIRNLKKIAHGLGALAVKAAHREADFADCLNDLVDQLAQYKPRQMQHGRGTHAGPDVRRTGGQVSKPRIESKIQFAFKRRVDFIDELERLFQLESGTNALHPEMIFLIDHDAERLPPIDHDRAARALCGMLTTYQLAPDLHLLIQYRQILQAFGERVLHLRKLFHAQPDLFED